MHIKTGCFLIIVGMATLACGGREINDSVEWTISDLMNRPDAEISGDPKIIASPYGEAVWFDGEDDAIFLNDQPLEGLSEFTVEVIMKPDSGGRFEQRFLHFGEVSGDRVLLELRAKPSHWYFDAYIQSGDSKLALIDSTRLHPLNRWHHVAYVVNNGDLATFISGRKELTGLVDEVAVDSGTTSIGVRLNRVHWYKGAIYKIKITPRALTPEDFLKLK